MQTRTVKTAQIHRMRIETIHRTLTAIHRMLEILQAKTHRTILARILQRMQTNTITKKKRVKADAWASAF